MNNIIVARTALDISSTSREFTRLIVLVRDVGLSGGAWRFQEWNDTRIKVGFRMDITSTNFRGTHRLYSLFYCYVSPFFMNMCVYRDPIENSTRMSCKHYLERYFTWYSIVIIIHHVVQLKLSANFRNQIYKFLHERVSIHARYSRFSHIKCTDLHLEGILMIPKWCSEP